MSLNFNGSGPSPNYAAAALDRECQALASTSHGRNEQANRSAFNMGQFVGAGHLDRIDVERRLFDAAVANGYVGKDGAPAARATIKSGLDKGEREPRAVPNSSTNGAARGTIHILKPVPQLSGVSTPDWTAPDNNGKPKFISIGKPEPMRFNDEARRHLYMRDGEAVRVKVKNTSGKFADWYRVQRPTDGAIGWQARKPTGYVPVPYVPAGARNPFDAERRGEVLVWSEGEKDAETLHAHGFHAFTFGGTSDAPDVAGLLDGHHVIIVADNDEPGEKCIPRKIEALEKAGAASIKTVRFPELQDGGDASDFFERGGTAEDFMDRAVRVNGPHGDRDGDHDAGVRTGDEPPNDLESLNAEFCVVLDGGKARVLHFEEERQKRHKRQVATYLSFEDFRNFHMNRSIQVGDKRVPLGQWWLKHSDRRQYRGLTFEPAAEQEINGRFNLWRGWGVEQHAGDWSRMKAHIREALAGGNDEFDAYIMRWVAWAVQHPAERAQAALVFKGKKGTGKGTLGNALCRIFGQHGTHISTAEHLAGRFNGHLRDACFLFADEAYWPGDKGAEGSLKRLVTEPDLFIEAKGKDGITVPNMLHVMMASNDEWVVPAGEDERRYAIFAVSDRYKQDETWFTPLNEQMEAGGYEAMLFDLLRFDLGDWHPRRIPRTEALLDQQSRGLNAEDAWWCELLETGVLWGSDPQRPERAVSNGWEEERDTATSSRMVRRKGLYDQARELSPRLKGFSDHLLAATLSKYGCDNGQKVMRRRGWHFPSLTRARSEWETRFSGWKWRDPTINEWQGEP